MGAPGFQNPANLKPPWQRGHKSPRASAAVLKGITKCRKLTPELVDFLAGVMRNEEHDIAVRVRAAEILLNKAIPTTGNKANVPLDPGASVLRIEIVDPNGEFGETVDARPKAPYPVGKRPCADAVPLRLTTSAEEKILCGGMAA